MEIKNLEFNELILNIANQFGLEERHRCLKCLPTARLYHSQKYP